MKMNIKECSTLKPREGAKVPANREELKDWVQSYDENKFTIICEEFGDLVFYGPEYSRPVWENVKDWVETDDDYWYQAALRTKAKALGKRANKERHEIV